MDLGLKNKTALVLASTKGIGKGIATSLAREGCRVLISSSNTRRLDEACSQIKNETGARVWTYTMSLNSWDSVEKGCQAILKEHQVDIFIANGPGPQVVDSKSINLSLLSNTLQTNLLSIVYLTNQLLPGMIDRKFGRIIHLTSTTAKEPDPGLVLSSMVRASILAYAKTLSREIAQYGITVNSILTGGVLTERTEALLKLSAERSQSSYDEQLKHAIESVPVGHISSPEEFSWLVTFLASPLSSYVNGASIPIDGGVMRGI